MNRLLPCTILLLGLAVVLVPAAGCGGGGGGGGGAPLGGNPVLVDAPFKYFDLNNNFILDAGDEIVFCFDRSVDAPGAPAADLLLSGGAVVGAGATWTDGPGANCVTLTLGAGETVTSGQTPGSTFANVSFGNTITNPADGTIGATPLAAPGQSIMGNVKDAGQNIGAGNSTAIAAPTSLNSATDAFIDIIVGKGPGPAEIYIATAAGAFGPMTTAVNDPGTHFTKAIAWDDLDGDGDIDFVTGNAGGQPNFTYINDGVGAGTFTHPVAPGQSELGTGNTNALELMFLDLAGAGPDLVVANGGTGAASTNWIYFDGGGGLFDGTGGFAGTNPLNFGGMANTVAMYQGDLDGGGVSDIVTIDATGGGGTITAYLVTPANPPLLGAVVTAGLSPNPTSCVLLPINTADADLDLVVGYDNGGGIQVWLGDGAGGFTLSQTIPGGNVGALTLTILNEDGRIDIVVGNKNGQPDKVFLSTGLAGPGIGTYLTDSKVSLGNGSTFDLAFGGNIGDIDGGGLLDFVSASNTPNKLWVGGK